MRSARAPRKAHLRVLCIERFGHCRAVVGRAIVDDYSLDGRMHLCQMRRDRAPQYGTMIEIRNDDRQLANDAPPSSAAPDERGASVCGPEYACLFKALRARDMSDGVPY
jgi:hypothetical protein